MTRSSPAVIIAWVALGVARGGTDSAVTQLIKYSVGIALIASQCGHHSEPPDARRQSGLRATANSLLKS